MNILSPLPKALTLATLSLGLVFSTGISGDAAVYSIDIDSTDPAGPIATAAGWTSFDATLGNASPALVVDGIDFTVASTDGSRLRGGDTPNPNPLTADFVFDDGAGQAIVFFFGQAGQLPAGTWQVEAWMFDATSLLGPSIVGYRTNGVETQITDNALANPTDPASTFTFESDGIARYDLYVRENNDENRSRLNAVRLTMIPEPGTVALALGGFCLSMLRRRRA